MAKVLDFPAPHDQWQFTVEVVLRPDGKYAAILVDCRASLIESGDTEPDKKLHELADILEQSIGPMRANAESLKD